MYFEFEDAPFIASTSRCRSDRPRRPDARAAQNAQPHHARGVRQDLQGRRQFKEPDLVVVDASYLYSDSSGFNFMDQESFET